MKILDIPQSGKRGLNVSMPGRYGQVSRTLVIPANPRTDSQMNTRAIFATVTAAWRGLTEPQRMAWTAAAKSYRSTPRCGQSGTLTGSQLHSKINCTLLAFGGDVVTLPPSKPQFPPLAPQNLIITNVAGVIAIKLTCPTDPGDSTIVRATPPLSAGQEVSTQPLVLGACPAPVAGAVDITNLYTTKFGAPLPGAKLFVRVNQMVDGHESIPRTFNAIVPAGA